MGIANNLKSMHPGGTLLADDYKVSHTPGRNGGEYAYETGSGQTGAVPYGPSFYNQRQAMASVALRIRSTMNNRSKEERRGPSTQERRNRPNYADPQGQGPV